MTELERLMPLHVEARVDLTGDETVGLVLVDPGVAFTTEGALADPVRMQPMVAIIDRQVRALRDALGDRLRILVFLDTHHPDIPEPPYPPHGILGTGEEEIDPALAWVLDLPETTLIRKDCINGFVGAIDRETGRNAFCDWVKASAASTLLVMGDCTDICVSDFVVAALSARNHGLLTDADPEADREAYVAAITGQRIVVLPGACATFHAPGHHDHEVAHHVGLWIMASRGAMLAEGWWA